MRQLLLLAMLCAPAWACVCGGYPSAKEAWLAAPLVLAGVIEKAEPNVTDGRALVPEQSAWVRVTEAFKGVKNGQVLEVHGSFSSCFSGFQQGRTLLLYLYPGEKQGTWVAPPCIRSWSLDSAVDDLQFLRGLPGSARGNRVSGVVSLYEDDPVKGFTLSRRVAGIRVRVSGDAGTYETKTDLEGLYEFRNLRPGSYQVAIDYPEGSVLRFPIVYGAGRGRLRDEKPAVTVTEESGNGVDFILAPDTRISGRVFDPDGAPMEGVCLDVEPVMGKPRNAPRNFDCTEADGSYDLHRMPAGNYWIVVNSGGRMSAKEPFGRLYYPGISDVEKAGILTVRAGQHLKGMDIRVPSVANRVELRGRLLFRDGVPLPRQSILFQGTDGEYLERGRTDEQGNFVMRILAGRSGELIGEILVGRPHLAACPQFGAKINPNGWGATVQSEPYRVAGEAGESDLRVVFPFASCAVWLEKPFP